MKKYDNFQMPVIFSGSLNEVSKENVIAQIDKNNFACIRGLFEPKKMADVIQTIGKRVSTLDFSSSVGEKPEAVRTNFCKMNIGGASLKYNNYPRFFRTMYNPVWEKDIWGMRDEFLNLIRLRNIIYGIDQEFALSGISENGLFSACRIQHYPSGGGFFSAHRDTTLLDVAAEKSVNFYQLILVLSEKGKDFSRGGAFLDRGEARFLLEEQCKPGDVLIYDGRSVHGVEDIDQQKRLSLSSISGRVAALASLYKI